MLLLGIEHRGNHATGMALMNADGAVHVHKAPDPAWKFVASKATEQFLEEFLNPETKTVLLHTRFATIGNPEVNENNHPMYKDRVAVVHNGGISNQIGIFSSENLTRNCETDSDVIRAILDRDGLTPEGVTSLNKLSGSAAIAAISADEPDKLLLARSGSPIKYCIGDTKLWWASEIKPLTDAVRPWVEKWGIWARIMREGVAFQSMPDNTAYLFGENGLERRQEFKACAFYRAPTYRTNESYAVKKKGWQAEVNKAKAKELAKPIVVIAPSGKTAATPSIKFGHCPSCKKGVEIPAESMWAGYTCPNKRCKTDLISLDGVAN